MKKVKILSIGIITALIILVMTLVFTSCFLVKEKGRSNEEKITVQLPNNTETKVEKKEINSFLDNLKVEEPQEIKIFSIINNEEKEIKKSEILNSNLKNIKIKIVDKVFIVRFIQNVYRDNKKISSSILLVDNKEFQQIKYGQKAKLPEIQDKYKLIKYSTDEYNNIKRDLTIFCDVEEKEIDAKYFFNGKSFLLDEKIYFGDKYSKILKAINSNIDETLENYDINGYYYDKDLKNEIDPEDEIDSLNVNIYLKLSLKDIDFNFNRENLNKIMFEDDIEFNISYQKQNNLYYSLKIILDDSQIFRIKFKQIDIN